jgi:hypothetical protein
MKNTVKVLAIIALLAVTGFSMAGCGDPEGGPIGSGDDTAISIAAIAGVTAPVQGATPVTAITANAQYTGTVAWSGTPATFAYAAEYTATITLTAKSGYTLQGVSAGFFTVAGALSVSNAANSGVVTATFPPTADDPGLLTLTGTIMISPDTGVTTGMELTATYNGGEAVSFQWKKDGVNVGIASTTNPNTYTPTEAGSYAVTVSVAGYNPKTSDPVTVTALVPPSASIFGSVTVTATKANISGNGALGADTAVTVSLTNATVNSALSVDASAWFTPPVAGLTYTASAAAGATAITITIEGIPTATSAANATISIPAGVVKNTQGTATTAALAVSGNVTYNIGEADPNALPTPAAAIASGMGGSDTVLATKANTNGNGGAAANASVTINLTNATVNSAITAADASAWFTPTVAGLSYTANASANATAITVTIAGTPTAVSTANATISIPAGVVKDTEGTATAAHLTVSGHITYNIDAAVEELSGFTFTPLANLVIGAGGSGNNVTQAGATVGSFSAPVGGTAPYTYSLVAGDGGTDNAQFAIDGTSLKVGTALTATKTYSVRVQVADGSSPQKTFDKAVTFTVSYPPALTPSAVLSGNFYVGYYEGGIYGVVPNTDGNDGYAMGAGLTGGFPITINLTNATVNSALSDANASAWFSSTVAGLTYKANAAAGASTITVNLTGMPQVASSAVVTMSIPANVLKDSNGNPSFTNALSVTGGAMKYSIENAPESVVRIGDTKYNSLSAAIYSASTTEIIVIKSFGLRQQVNIETGYNVTIKAETDGLTISRGISYYEDGSTYSGTFFEVTGGSLTLGGGGASHTPTLIIDGGRGEASSGGTLVSVKAQNGLTIQKGVELREAYRAVYIYNDGTNGSTYSATMTGGAIASCYIGVYLTNSGGSRNAYFTMNGGIIYGSSEAAGIKNNYSISANSNSAASASGTAITAVTGGSTIMGSANGEDRTETFGTAP